MSYPGAEFLATGADGPYRFAPDRSAGSAGADVTALAQYKSFGSHARLDLPDPPRRNIKSSLDRLH